MNDSPQDAPAVTLADIAARLDDLTRDVRRQGKAAVAAQAAAESCLERLSEQAAQDDDDEAGDDDARAQGDTAEQWVRALLPVADALDRMVAHAAAMADRPAPAAPERPRGLLRWLATEPAKEPSREGEIRALAEGLRVLRAQLAASLESRGVVVDRRTGVPVDPEIHRVVETRAPAPGQAPGIVLEIVRPGYSLSDHPIREAEVVASRAD